MKRLMLKNMIVSYLVDLDRKFEVLCVLNIVFEVLVLKFEFVVVFELCCIRISVIMVIVISM